MSSFDEQYEPTPYDPIAESRRNTVEGLAGFFAAAALFSSLVALAYHPVPISVGACLLALVASGMSVRHKTLCFAAVLVSGTCFVGGLVIAVVTGHSLW
jgi:4-hydroxybenzoate polyprenyltransferase